MMKKTPALILTAIAAVLAVLALIFYLTSGVTMAYVTALSAGAIVACVLYLVLYPKLGDRQHLSLLISAAAVMALLTVFAVSCKKEKKVEDDSKPVIECEANPNFGEFEIMDDLNADVVVNAKEELVNQINTTFEQLKDEEDVSILAQSLVALPNPVVEQAIAILKRDFERLL